MQFWEFFLLCKDRNSLSTVLYDVSHRNGVERGYQNLKGNQEAELIVMIELFYSCLDQKKNPPNQKGLNASLIAFYSTQWGYEEMPGSKNTPERGPRNRLAVKQKVLLFSSTEKMFLSKLQA